MITALLVDDEPLAIRYLAELLAGYPWLQVVGMVKSVSEARCFLERHIPDLIFLDVEMPRGSGLDLLPVLPPATKVVFVTAYESYAVAAFAAGALDYLVKPVLPDRLGLTLERFGSCDPDTIDPAAEAPAGEDGKTTTVFCRKEGKANLINLSQIAWIEGLQNYTRVQIRGASQGSLFRRRLSDWAVELPESAFPRLGRSFILQLALIRNVEWRSRDETLLFFQDVTEPVVISRTYSARLKTLLMRGASME
jgi:two-component system LytT family response regulator